MQLVFFFLIYFLEYLSSLCNFIRFYLNLHYEKTLQPIHFHLSILSSFFRLYGLRTNEKKIIGQIEEIFK